VVGGQGSEADASSDSSHRQRRKYGIDGGEYAVWLDAFTYARESLWVRAFSFDVPELIEKAIMLHTAGVVVRFIVDGAQMKNYGTRKAAKKLVDAGIPVKEDWSQLYTFDQRAGAYAVRCRRGGPRGRGVRLPRASAL
jgi:hypothetical protein